MTAGEATDVILRDGRLSAEGISEPPRRRDATVAALAGIVQDDVFGPLVAFGPGGVLAGLIGEATFRIAPLTDQDAEELVHEVAELDLNPVLAFSDRAVVVDARVRVARRRPAPATKTW